MGADTKIQWATHTFNPWRGCAKIAAGCANCYADAQSKRNPNVLGIWGENGTRVVASEAMWREPIKWNRDAACCCRKEICDHEHEAGCTQRDRPRVFCASLADVFEDWKQEVRTSSGMVLHQCADGHLLGLESAFANGCDCIHGCERIARPATLADIRARLFRLIDQAMNLDLLLLTKRPENVRRMIWDVDDRPKQGTSTQEAKPPKRRDNVWLGVSVSTQDDADRLIPELIKCRDLCAKLFVSAEPLLATLDLSRWLADGIDWVIVGGESGANARPCNVAWIRAIVRQCRDAGVPVFVKQLGAICLDNDPESRCSWPGLTQFHVTDDKLGRVLLRDKKGGDTSEWPEDLRVREVPT